MLNSIIGNQILFNGKEIPVRKIYGNYDNLEFKREIDVLIVKDDIQMLML